MVSVLKMYNPSRSKYLKCFYVTLVLAGYDSCLYDFVTILKYLINQFEVLLRRMLFALSVVKLCNNLMTTITWDQTTQSQAILRG